MKAAIIVLGGGLTKDTKGAWHTTTLNDRGDRYGVQGDRLRVEAAAILAKKHPHRV